MLSIVAMEVMGYPFLLVDTVRTILVITEISIGTGHTSAVATDRGKFILQLGTARGYSVERNTENQSQLEGINPYSV